MYLVVKLYVCSFRPDGIPLGLLKVKVNPYITLGPIGMLVTAVVGCKNQCKQLKVE